MTDSKMNHLFPYPKMGKSWLEILEDPLTRKLLGHDAIHAEKIPFVAGVHSRFKYLLQDPLKHLSFAKIGYTALEAFLQANCTGPPLDFDSMPVIVPEMYRDEMPQMREEMMKSLSVDGIDVYPLTPRIELFWLAKCLMDNATLAEEGFNGRRARMRVNFWHQKLLPETSDTLRNIIYHDASILDSQMSSRLVYGGAAAQEHMVEFLVERGTIRVHYKDEEPGREDLLRAAKLRDFEFAMTGIPGKKTKYQQNDVTQLVVLAKSRDHEPEPYSSRKSSRADSSSRKGSVTDRSVRSMSLRPMTPGSPDSDMGQMFSSMAGQMSPTGVHQPENIPLNDDTLFETIQFNARPPELLDPATEIVTDQSHLPISLAFMDPNEQPQLFPMDAIILLTIAESITNTQASDGLTREESLPYATRVLEGGSSNWTVYSQALLIRSRIEGYRSRTTERGLLQLQALVDQVISETTHNKFREAENDDGETSVREVAAAILPAGAEEDERSSVAERLRFIHQVSPPMRWELEAELAARWTQMGGLKTALEIYERLHMTPEVALCLAATDREAEAVKLLKKTLFVNPDQEMKDGDTVELQNPLPSESPRLLCILGDIEAQPKYYNLAWMVSSQRYARAKRSLGAFYLKKRDLASAVESYEAALRIARQDLATWFSLGCIYLELEDWQAAVECFSRVVQLDDRDAQAYSNLAIALLKMPPPTHSPKAEKTEEPSGLGIIEENTSDDNEGTVEIDLDPLQHTREALRALRRAAHLQREDARIWDNYLTVAASIPPDPDHPEKSTPWQEVIHAMSHVIRLRHKKEGEGCVDLKILDALLDHVTNMWDYPAGEDEEEQQTNGKNTSEHLPVKAPETSTDTKDNAVESSDTNNHLGRPRSRSRSRSRQHSPDSPADPEIGTELDIVETLKSEVPRTPFLVRTLTTIIDTQITPLATSSPQLFLILSQAAIWRHRPADALAYIEKSWRATTNRPKATPAELVEATGTLVNAYQTLGPMERERTGGLVEKGWKFKSRTAVRSMIGKAKGVWDDTVEYKELEDMMKHVRGETTAE